MGVATNNKTGNINKHVTSTNKLVIIIIIHTNKQQQQQYSTYSINRSLYMRGWKGMAVTIL